MCSQCLGQRFFYHFSVNASLSGCVHSVKAKGSFTISAWTHPYQGVFTVLGSKLLLPYGGERIPMFLEFPHLLSARKPKPSVIRDLQPSRTSKQDMCDGLRVRPCCNGEMAFIPTKGERTPKIITTIFRKSKSKAALVKTLLSHYFLHFLILQVVIEVW